MQLVLFSAGLNSLKSNTKQLFRFPLSHGYKVTKKYDLKFKKLTKSKSKKSKSNLFFKSTFGTSILLTNNYTIQNIATKSTHIQNNVPIAKNIFINLLLKIYRLAKLLFRCGVLFIVLSPIFIFYPFSYFGNTLNNLWWRMTIFSLETAGPVFVKLGQWASTRRDLFSEDVCNHLSHLQHSVGPHSWHETRAILNNAFGNDWEKLFVDFNESNKPVGSGCVAQVYKVHIKPEFLNRISSNDNFLGFNLFKMAYSSNTYAEINAIPVAVKVLHPGIQERIERDLSILHSTAHMLETIIPRLKWMSVKDCVKVFDDFIISQVNLAHEAALLDKFRENFVNEPFVSFPVPLRPLVTENVLVETWESGIPLSHYLINKNDFQESFKKGIATIGIKTLFKMIFKDNLVHADLHPGNILVSLGENGTHPRLIILDCGLAASLSNHDFNNFHQVFKAVAVGNGAKVAQLFLDNSVSECNDPTSFTFHMEKIVNEARQTLTISKLNVTMLLNDVFTLLTVHKVKLEANFLSVILSILVLEGLGKSLDPKLDILQQALPYLLY